MPIYEYECQSCKHVLDALQKMSDEPLRHCPSCGEPELKKLLSAPRFRLKGSGWYETDFKDKNRRNIAGDESAKSAGKSDSKSSSTKKGTVDSTTKAAKPASKSGGD
ncbi:MAG: FmdB family zinc ribbon protein [Gammaproteobacteria bacterium]